MKFKSEKELKEFVLARGCFDEAENLRIYRKFFLGSTKRAKRLSGFLDFEGQNVLEAGCSYGHFLIHLPQGSVGIEIQPRMIEFTRSLGLKVISANIEERIPVSSSSFDMIYCNAVLEHMVSPHNLLIEFHRILKPDGKLVIGVPNMDAINYKGWKALEHLYAYNKKSLEFLLERAGFQVVKVWGNLRLSKLTNYMPIERLVLKFSSNILYYGKKKSEFSYPEKRLEIFTPSWMKKA